MEEKEIKILKSALDKFSKFGFTKTSISDIYTDAKVSKGLVYYYFKDKKDLYLSCLDYSYNLVKSEIEKYFDKKTDLISRLSEITIAKMEFFLINKSVMDFLVSYQNETAKTLDKELKEYSKKNNLSSMSIIENELDSEFFIDDLDSSKTIDIISFTLGGAYNKAVLLNNKEDRARVIYEYEDYLKQIFYKKKVK